MKFWKVFVIVGIVVFLVFASGLFKKDFSVGEENNYSVGGEPVLYVHEINVIEAYHLSKDKEEISDIYLQIKEQDGEYSKKIYSGESVRVKFNETLSKENDLKIYVRNTEEKNTTVEVYTLFGEKVSEFPIIKEEGLYQIYLDNLTTKEEYFDLKIVNLDEDELAYLEFDYITDPVTGGFTSGGLRPQSVICYAGGGVGTCQGTYPAACSTDRLSCNDGVSETQQTSKGGFAGVDATYFDTSVVDCVLINRVQACYEWISDRADPTQCTIDFDESGDGWSNIILGCPGTAGASGCVDITSNDVWSCSNFFGSTGNRAMLRTRATSTQSRGSLVSVDQLWYNVSYTAAGSLSASLDEPAVSVSSKTVNEAFLVSATVQCGGDVGDSCGDVTGTLRYAVSPNEPSIQVSTNSASMPFYSDLGVQTCTKLNATSGENSCTLNWQVNATEIGSYNLDVIFDSEYSIISSADTNNAQIDVFGPPYLVVDLASPLSDPGISEGEQFLVNCSVECNSQDCLEVVTSLKYCSGSLFCNPNNLIETDSLGLSANVNSVNLGTISSGTTEYALFQVTGEIYGDYVFMCSADSSNTPINESTQVSLHVNSLPFSIFTYPINSSWLNSIETINAGSSYDLDGEIVNYKFEIDDNFGFSSPTILCDSSSSTCSLDTVSQTQCSQESALCYLKLTVRDDSGTENSTVIQVGIDNVGPTASLGFPLENSYINTGSYLVNGSGEDFGSGLACLEFSAYYSSAWNNIGVDCSSPFEINWDLAPVPEGVLIVRVRANDTEGNFGEYSVHTNITYDVSLPVIVSDSPADFELIHSSPYLLNASSSFDSISGMKNISWYYYNSGWNLIGIDTDPSNGFSYLWDIGISDGVYEIKIEGYDNAGLNSSIVINEVTIDVENENPYCEIVFPSGGEELKGLVNLQAYAFDLDPSDNVENVSFYYSSNNGSTWNFIGTNTTSGINNYSYLWDTNLGEDSSEYLINCSVYDSREGFSQNVSGETFTIDNAAPVIGMSYSNVTDVSINDYACFNVSVTDNFVGVKEVISEIMLPLGIRQNVTMLDDGLGCDAVSSDGVFSIVYPLIYDGVYNWSRVYAKDNLENSIYLDQEILINVTSNAYLISELLSPLFPFEINESSPGNSFIMSCNITCDEAGVDCSDVVISAEYDYDGFIDITTSTSGLVNTVDDYSCGFLAGGESCTHNFIISSTENSGNRDYNLRCHGASFNAAADLSSTVQVHINDNPYANFSYPTNSSWLNSIEVLNAGSSYDLDGEIVNYKFEIDDNFGFSSSSILCDSSSSTCSLDTVSQTQCSQEGSSCYLKLTVRDDSGTENSTVIQVGIDNVGPTASLGFPLENSYINTGSYLVNGSGEDFGSGLACLEFSAYYSSTWNNIGVDCSSPFEINWNLISVSEGVLDVRVRANDTEGNFGEYSVHTNITYDKSPPEIIIVSPQEDLLTNQRDIEFNFGFTDSISSSANCSLNLNGSVIDSGIFLNNTLNTFQTFNLDEGIYLWNISCVDLAGNKNESFSRNLEIDLSPPDVLLDFPQNNYWSSEELIQFNYTPIDNNLEECRLYGNWSGVWKENQTEENPLNWEVNTFELSLNDGSYLWNVWCNDSTGNSASNVINHSLNVDTVYPTIKFENGTLANNTYQSKDYVFVNVSVNETNVGEVILNWNGTNETITNFIGNNYWVNKTGLSEGVYSYRVYVVDLGGKINFTEERIVGIDFNSPLWFGQNQTVNGVFSNTVYHGEKMNLSVSFNDTYGLNGTWLSTNETGGWINYSIMPLAGKNNLSSFNWTNFSLIPGQDIYWKIYAKDLAGNVNFSDESSFKVWGRSEIDFSYLSPSGITQGSTTTMNCHVQDNATKRSLSGYSVSFYKEGVLLGTNVTETDGYAKYSFSETDAGSYQIMCNIANDLSKYYNGSSKNYSVSNLGVGYGLSIYDYRNTTFNKAYEGITQTTTTQIDDPYTDLTNDDSIYQDFQAGAGNYAYTRFELKVEDSKNSITKLNVTWNGMGEVGSGTQGYILYFYNFTSGTWILGASSTSALDSTQYVVHTEGISDLINESGMVWFLARSYSAAPTGGGQGSRWARISTDYIDLKVYTDILAPEVVLNYPEDYTNTSLASINFNCSVSDDTSIANVSLVGEWNSGWKINSTNSSGINDADYLFNLEIEEGVFNWNCLACDVAGNCESSPLNRTITVDRTAPEVNLVYPNLVNFSGYLVSSFNFTANDSNPIEFCSLVGNWSGVNLETIYDLENETQSSFGEQTLPGDGFYSWNVNCSDYSGNFALSPINATFASFMFPDSPELLNITQSANDGTGTITLFWNETNHSIRYLIYSGDSLDSLIYLGETESLNYTDSGLGGSKRKYYQVHSWNPTGENLSEKYFGSHLYNLMHNGVKSRNLIYFPSNASYLATANETFSDINNAESFTMYNSTTQKRVTCNEFSCPASFSCTETTCNFQIEAGRGYEVDTDIFGPQEVNWSIVGIVHSPVNLELVKKPEDFGKNWLGVPAGSSLNSARDLMGSITSSDAVSRWNSLTQKSEGLIPSPIPFIPGPIGKDFALIPEEGYEVSVTSSGGWMQE